MRITSGIARGILLDSPKGDATRPATDAARLAIFSSLGEIVENAKVLDLFAGTGSYGLEAVSRGAKDVTFVEKDRRALDCLKKNIEAVKKCINTQGENANFKVLSIDCIRAVKNLSATKFDVVFADPPYHMLLESKTLELILDAFALLATGSTIFVLEAPADFDFPENNDKYKFEIIKRLGKKSKGKPSQFIVRG